MSNCKMNRTLFWVNKFFVVPLSWSCYSSFLLFLCCPIMCHCALHFVWWLQQRFPHLSYVRFDFAMHNITLVGHYSSNVFTFTSYYRVIAWIFENIVPSSISYRSSLRIMIYCKGQYSSLLVQWRFYNMVPTISVCDNYI